MLSTACDINLPYVTHYKNLAARYSSPEDCLKYLEREFFNIVKRSFDNAAADHDSRLGTYLQINPTLSTPLYLSKTMIETDRLVLTRFRCGSHSLLIEIGRYNRTQRCDRICTCGIGIQTVLHCFTECPLVLPLLQKRYTSMQDIFENDDICFTLHSVCKALKFSI